jgi:hypothetical protein
MLYPTDGADAEACSVDRRSIDIDRGVHRKRQRLVANHVKESIVSAAMPNTMPKVSRAGTLAMPALTSQVAQFHSACY